MLFKTTLSVRVTCGLFKDERVVLSSFEAPIYTESCFLQRQNFTKGEAYTVQLKRDGKVIAEKGGKLPMDWKNPLDWAVTVYSVTDKKLLKAIPFIGKFLEGLAPDAQWQFDVWYQLIVDETGNCDYKIHIGPSSTIDFRDKLEGSLSL